MCVFMYMYLSMYIRTYVRTYVRIVLAYVCTYERRMYRVSIEKARQPLRVSKSER
jgi:hypothetical protein